MSDSSRPVKPGGTGRDVDPPAAAVAEMNASPFVGVSVRQGKAIEALLQGVPIVRAAQAAGIHERTLRKWMRRHKFRLALFDARREAFAQAVGLTQKFAPNAVGTLVKVMNDPGAGASAKVMAATALLKFGRESLEIDDLNARVEQLEAFLATPAKPPVIQTFVEEDRT